MIVVYGGRFNRKRKQGLEERRKLKLKVGERYISRNITHKRIIQAAVESDDVVLMINSFEKLTILKYQIEEGVGN